MDKTKDKKTKLLFKTQIKGSEVFDIIRNYIIGKELVKGNKNIMQFVNSKKKYLTMIEVKENLNAPLRMDMLVEIFEVLK